MADGLCTTTGDTVGLGRRAVDGHGDDVKGAPTAAAAEEGKDVVRDADGVPARGHDDGGGSGDFGSRGHGGDDSGASSETVCDIVGTPGDQQTRPAQEDVNVGKGAEGGGGDGGSGSEGAPPPTTESSGSGEDDCRKKRCADRYDSSESSDSGVAVLSCTDCSGSSTASSDITDPGSPFSTASSHSEDSALQPAKMPPTQSAHHPPWPWTGIGESLSSSATTNKRSSTEGNADLGFPTNKKMKKCEEESALGNGKQQSTNGKGTSSSKTPPATKGSINHQNTNINTSNNNNSSSKSDEVVSSGTKIPNGANGIVLAAVSVQTDVINHNNNNVNKKVPITNLLLPQNVVAKQTSKKTARKTPSIDSSTSKTQGKITEYFKSQMKANGIKKVVYNVTSKPINTNVKASDLHKYFSMVGGLKQQPHPISAIKQQSQIIASNAKPQAGGRKGGDTKPTPGSLAKRAQSNDSAKSVNNNNRKLSPVTVPRKILPAPSKVCDKVPINSINNISAVNNFAPNTVTLTTLAALPPNLTTYIHPKAPKPPDNFIVQQFTAIPSDKINAIPIVNTPCINTVIHTGHHQLQNISTINNFIKLNATVVPIVKLNALPSKLNGSTYFNNNTTANSLNLVEHQTIPPGATVVAAPKARVLHSTTGEWCLPAPSVALAPPTTPIAQVVTASTTNLLSVVASNGSPVTAATCDGNVAIPQEQPIPGAEQQASVGNLSDSSGVSSGSKDHPLEVSIPSAPAVESQQKSPILSQPKTIRFPAVSKPVTETKEARSTSSQSSSDSTVCRWSECHAQFDTSGALLEHLQLKHVISQETQEQYVCLWTGCKVHGRKSCSRSWLERHVLAHAGTKPFRCIVEGCGMRYNSQLALERHVNSHFSTDGSQNGSSAKKSVESSSVKLFKRNGKRIRFRRQPWSARMFDFFDSGIMEGLQHKLLRVNQVQTQGQRDGVSGDSVLMHSELLAKRIENDGTPKYLLRWHPENILPDEWVTEKEHTKTRLVSIRKMEQSSVNSLQHMLFSPSEETEQNVRQKQRRKRCSIKNDMTNGDNCNT